VKESSCPVHCGQTKKIFMFGGTVESAAPMSKVSFNKICLSYRRVA